MKLFSVNFKVGRDIILKKFTKSVKSLLIIHKNNYINLYSMYTEEEIEDAINSIYYIDDAFYAPVSGKNGMILRYLEYGGPQMKSLKLLSRASRVISRRLDGDEYVF